MGSCPDGFSLKEVSEGWAFCLLVASPIAGGIQEMSLKSVDRSGEKGRERELAARDIAEIIRGKSELGELVSLDEIFQELLDRNLLKGDDDQAQSRFEVIIGRALEENKDLIRLHLEGEKPLFFSSQLMSESYAKMLIQKRLNPLLLIAEIVRENSMTYPRPVPVDIFRESPFNLTQEEILECLRQMGNQKEYQDIVQTTTSIGTIFLYSTLHLTPGYASMLAEWSDVGQVNNP